jgi:hypothetical protein
MESDLFGSEEFALNLGTDVSQGLHTAPNNQVFYGIHYID